MFAFTLDVNEIKKLIILSGKQLAIALVSLEVTDGCPLSSKFRISCFVCVFNLLFIFDVIFALFILPFLARISLTDFSCLFSRDESSVFRKADSSYLFWKNSLVFLFLCGSSPTAATAEGTKSLRDCDPNNILFLIFIDSIVRYFL